MRTKAARFFGGILLALAFAPGVFAYTYLTSSLSNQPLKWHPATLVMHVEVGATPTSTDGNYNNTILAAISVWNANLSTVQIIGTIDATPPSDGDSINTVVMSSNVYGDTFDATTLAITTTWSYGFNDSRAEADVVFNDFSVNNTNNFSWDSYRGPRRGNLLDLRRVAIHELGHALGLDHPDDAGQSVSAIMNSHVGDIDYPAADDLEGAQRLYGTPGAAAPANDNFASATLITQSDGTAYTGSNVYPNAASREAGEPTIAHNQGAHSVWWKWVAPGTASVSVDTRGSNIDTILGVYTGAAVNALTLVQDNDDEFTTPHDQFNTHTSLVTFTATGGTTYYIAVDGFYDGYSVSANYHIAGDMGDITVHLSQGPIGVAPTISDPASASITAGSNATFSVTATGTPAPGLQWQRQASGGGGFSNLGNDGTYSGVTTTTLTVSNASSVMNGDQFRCVATNSIGTATSNPATLTVSSAPVITGQPGARTVTEGTSTTFSASASGAPIPNLQWQRLPSGSGIWSNLANAGVYSGVTTGTLTLSSVTRTMTGDNFRCVATNTLGSATSNAAGLTIQYGPEFITQPSNQSVTLGGTATFSFAGTNGNPAPTLQWQRLPATGGGWANLGNGGNYGGVTTASLTVSSTTAVMNGDQFRCVATNAITSATSNAVTLTITSPVPVFSLQPLSRSASTVISVTFTIGVIGTPTPTLQWQRLPAGSGVWADLADGGSYAGVTTATLTVSSLTLAMNGDQFRCVATNTNGNVPSNAATLTVGLPMAGDFNSDLQKDIVWENTATGERALWLMNGTVYIGGASFGVIAPAWRIAGSADFNGDGKTDILWENTVTGDRMIWLMDGVNYVSTVDMGIVSTAWRIAATADFNGDHKTDIMVENTSTGERVLWLMNGTTVSSTISYGTIPTAWRIAASADFNHDGQIDIVWENTTTGQHAIWLMNGTVFQSAIDFGSIPAEWRLATVGDFNGDGDADFFWENTLTGDRALWLMHGTIFSTSIYFGIIPTDWNITP